MTEESRYASGADPLHVCWTGILLAPGFHLLFLLLPRVTNFIKERRLARLLAAASPRQEELRDLERELASISMTEEFARHAKLQRRINAVRDELGAETKDAALAAAKLKASVQTPAYFFLVVCLLVTIVYHKSTPLMVLPSSWFGEVNWLISFPTGIDGAVGFTFWLFVCRRLLNSIHSRLAPASANDSDDASLTHLVQSLLGSLSSQATPISAAPMMEPTLD